MSGQEVQVQDLLRTLSSLTRRVYYGINRAATDCKVKIVTAIMTNLIIQIHPEQ